MTETLTCFKAYDIRGRIPDELNEDIAYRIGRAYGQQLRPKNMVVGRDIRLTSDVLALALSRGLRDEGVNVFDIGLCGTEEIYFATSDFQANGVAMDGGIVVTASHNPKDYNGMKLVREGSRPISGDTGLREIQALVEANQFAAVDETTGDYTQVDVADAYIQHLLSYIELGKLPSMTVVVNAGNGAAGHVIDKIEQYLPSITFVKIHHQPDGHFPNGVPNPLLPENRTSTIAAIEQHNADLGIAWDGDFDRCFLFDEKGRFIEGYYIVGLLAKAFLQKSPGAKVIHDPRLTWNTIDIVAESGGRAIQSKTGHAFIKERMRKEDAVYGGEMSAHHYFRDFAYCDSGMIPWLLVLGLIADSGKPMSELVDDRITKYPSSGEINRRVEDAKATINQIQQRYQGKEIAIDFTDGLSMDFGEWRFNLRSSNTEPVIRLNVESRADESLMRAKTQELLLLIGGAE